MTDLQPILSAVRQAAILCRRIQQSQFVRAEKAYDDPVTIADYGAQIILHRAISRAFPGDAIISEEQSSQFLGLLDDGQRAEIVQLLTEILDENVTQADAVRWLDHGNWEPTPRTWVIDPIDGTKGFIGLRRYTIAVALLQAGEPVAGVLGSPGHPHPDNLGVIFYTAGNGAVVEPMAGGPPTPIRVSDRSDMATVRVVESVVPQHSDLERGAAIRSALGIPESSVEHVDSQEKYGLVASGEADLYMRIPRGDNPVHYIWDHAAGMALVRAAGGRVTDLDGSPLDFSQGRTLVRNRGMVVSNGLIHDRVLEALAAITGIQR